MLLRRMTGPLNIPMPPGPSVAALLSVIVVLLMTVLPARLANSGAVELTHVPGDGRVARATARSLSHPRIVEPRPAWWEPTCPTQG